MDVSDRTNAALGFEDVKRALAGRCRTEMGASRAQARPLLADRDEVLRSLELIAQTRRLRQEPLSLPIGGLKDVRAGVEQAAKGGMLEPRALLETCQCLFAFERTADVLRERQERYAGLYELARQLPLLGKLATKLDRAIEPSFEISDRASPALRDAREHARGLHRRIRQRLDELLRDTRFAATLRESYYSVRNDRYVVPVLAGQQREVDGIVHNASQSGQTLFVEPQELIGLGNQLAIAQSLVLEEERKVLLELSNLVGREASGIIRGVEACAQLDELEAAASLATDLNANAPTVEPADGRLTLKGLRHPRLLLKALAEPGPAVIANDVDLGDQARALVVSGPNAGGKTVTLTGVGLSALMLRAGLPIPCDEGSRMPLFSQVHSAVGDQQSLEAGLSTFSAHVVQLRDMTQVARRGALVLIDEIAADTDPREGAAIATAVLEDLLGKGALVLVTTHLEELKALAHLDPRFVNARVGFDAKRMAPTYRLQLGFAGASSAIDIARRSGLSEAICARAVDLATNAGGALSKALQAAEDERRRLHEQREQATTDASGARRLRAELEQRLEEASATQRSQELKYRESLRAELEYARTQLRELIEKLERAKGEGALKAAKAASAELTARINEQTQGERVLRQASQAPEDLAPLKLEVGAKARHLALGTEVEIVDVGQDTLTVMAGTLRMRVAPHELGPTQRKQPAPSTMPGMGSKAQDRLKRAEAAAKKPLTLASPKLDVRGQRAEDAVRLIERFLDRAAQDGEEAALIVHGHGTGALKAGIREYLQQSPYAKDFRSADAAEGGDGVTIVVL